MKNHRKRPSWQTIILVAGILAIAPQKSFSQGFAAERAYEQRMQKLYGSPATTKDEENEIASLSKNTPPNLLYPESVYWAYFKAKGENYINQLDENSLMLKNYLSYVRNVSLARYNEFDRRRLVSAAIEEIKKGAAEIDYDTEYAYRIFLTSVDQYNFKWHGFRTHVQANSAQIALLPGFKFFGLNLAGTINTADFKMEEDAAEKFVRKMQGKDISRNIVAVYYFKFNPKLFTTRGGAQHLSATVSRAEFFCREWRNNKPYFGEKIGEARYGTDPWVHPEL